MGSFNRGRQPRRSDSLAPCPGDSPAGGSTQTIQIVPGATQPRRGRPVEEVSFGRAIARRPLTPKRWPMVRLLGGLAAFSATLTALAAAALAGAPNARPAATGGWQVEKGVERPSYAVAEPSRTDLNIDSVVLICEPGPKAPVVQLRLYLSGNGPLAPTGVANLRDDPKVELAIDNASQPIDLLFADEFVVLADASEGMVPLLSTRLLDALQAGKRMELRFHYVQDIKGGRTRPIDATAVVDLQAGPGGNAVAAVRSCGGGTDASPQVAHAPVGNTR